MKKKKKVTRKRVVKKGKKVEIKAASKKARKPKKEKQQRPLKTKKEKAPSTPKISSAGGAAVEEIGIVTHYFPHVEAAVVKLTKGPLSVGDTIVIKGHTTDFKEKVGSLQLDHAPVDSASVGQEIGLKVKTRVREHDAVYKLVD